MQILTGDEIFDRYGCPSHPVSPTPLSTPPKNMKTVGDELGENNQITTLQAERELSLQQPHQQRQQQLSTLPSQFPPELIDHIVDHLHDDKQSLIQCSRASRVFSHATSYHLFRTVAVPSVRSCVKFQELIQCSLHPISSTPTTPHPSTPSSASTSSSPSPPAPRTVYHQPHHLHPHSDRIHVNSPVGHAQASDCDVSAAGWDISRFVRKIEFYGLDPQSPIEEYVSEAVKLVRMLPRIREVVFAWWMQATGLEKIGQAFADISVIAGHHTHPSNRPLSSATTSTPPEARVEQIPTGDPLKLHLELVDFESVHAFLDFLGSFGGRLRELSLASITLGGGRGNGKDNVEGRYLPGLECVCLGYDAVVQPKAFGEDGPTMGGIMNTNVFFGIPAFEQTRDVCEILESVAPNVSELQLFRDDVAEVCMGRECLHLIFPIVSIFFYLIPFRRKRFASPYFHIFTLRYLPSLPVTGSLFASLVPWTRRWVVCPSFFRLYR
ncbi:hypothetical protein BDM02DRAFT_3118676 [Thelephora ganbajun]|uniref:Uncharacterized protein n=1 Tax=Thelephora ganbajun TaxID=370292 RepID=A0ACB6ZAA4_THEGA|nr:hypothetical protein BDM02DRAFT_3118676 [Thelephora ganbajun]